MYINFNKSKILKHWLKNVYKHISEDQKSVFDASIIFSDDIKSLNLEYRGIDKTTDVLSFNSKDIENDKYIGDLILSIDDISSNALDFEVDFHEELIRCIVHGTLHLLGFDHIGHLNKRFVIDEKTEKMFLIQERLIKDIIYGSNLSKIQKSDI